MRLAALALLACGCGIPASNRDTLRVVTQPPGAQVYVDGQHVGQSPVDVDVEIEPHQVLAVACGYDDAYRGVAEVPNWWALLQFVVFPLIEPSFSELETNMVVLPMKPGRSRACPQH